MKRYVLIITFVVIICLTGCCYNLDGKSYQIQEQPHLYWKDIDVVITDIERFTWYASTHWYVVKLTVKSEEYGIVESFEIRESGAFNCPKQWNYKVGQTVKAQLYSWVMDSSGKVVIREIHKVY